MNNCVRFFSYTFTKFVHTVLKYLKDVKVSPPYKFDLLVFLCYLSTQKVKGALK